MGSTPTSSIIFNILIPLRMEPTTRNIRKKFLPILIPLLIVIFSLILRLALISKGAYHLDNLTMAIRAELTASTGRLHYLHSHGFPLSAIIAGWGVQLARLFGLNDPVAAMNLMAVLFSTACLPLYYLLALRLFDLITAFYGTLLFSLNPVFLGNSVYGNTHVIALFFLLSAIILLDRYLNERHKLLLLAAAAAFGLAGAARLQDTFIVMPAMLVYALTAPGLSPKQKGTTVGFTLLISTGIITLFYLPALTSHAGAAGLFSSGGLFYREIGRYLIGYHPALFSGIKDFFLGTFPYNTALPILGGLVLLWENHKRLLFTFLVWIAFPLSVYLNVAITTPRFFMVCLIPLTLCLAFCLTRLGNLRRWLKPVAAGFFLFILAAQSWQIIPVLYFRHTHALYPDFCRWLNTATPPGSLIIDNDNGTFINYYSDRTAISRPRRAPGDLTDEDLRTMKETIDGLHLHGTPVYITTNDLFAYNTTQLTRFLKTHYTLRFSGKHLIEDWHHGVFVKGVGYSDLLRILPKSRPRPGP